MARYAGSGAAVRSAETRGRAPEGRGGAPHELPPEERLSIMSIRAAHKSSTIRAMERLTKRGFAEFVDNVDTRARRKIHFIRPSGACPALGRGTTVANRQYRQSPIFADRAQKDLVFFPPRPPNRFCDLRLARSTFTKPDFKMIVRSTMTTTQWHHLNI